MYLGFLTVCLKNMPLEDKIVWAGANGFKALEIACWPKDNTRDYSSADINVDQLNYKEAAHILRLMKDNGLIISSLAYYDNNLHADPHERKKINDHLMKVIDAAVLLSANVVGTFIGRDVGKDIKENFDEYERVFGKIIRYAEEKGIQIVIENCPMEGWQIPGLPGTISFTPELWKEMFRRIPSRNLGLNYDPSHLLLQKINYLAPLSEYKDRIYHVHAKDTEIFEDKFRYYGVFNRQLDMKHGEGYWRYRMPGFGNVDWKAFINELKKIGYDSVVSIEHEDTVYDGTDEKVKEGLVLGRDYLKKLL